MERSVEVRVFLVAPNIPSFGAGFLHNAVKDKKMLMFLSCCLLLLAGYALYGLFVERVFGLSRRPTPAVAHPDGADYIPMKTPKALLIQFLNIAGLGPVFGAVLGAVYGPVCLIWIVLGSIFAGAVHDYLSGMLSLRHDGKSLVFLMETYFGHRFRYIALFLLTAMLLIVGTIFAKSPAQMLGALTHTDVRLWLGVVFGYYFIATLLPIDKIIGRFYPLFALCLIVASVLLVGMLFTRPTDLWLKFDLINHHPAGKPIFPLLFVTIACGAISGFHATQSPMMARCLMREQAGRPVFYGAMITEGVIALIWATLGLTFYPDAGHLWQSIQSVEAGGTVAEMAKGLLGSWGGTLTVVSVVILAITTGDTCFRSARLALADFVHMPQDRLARRLSLTLGVLGGGLVLSAINIATIWQYFGWFNQTLATCTLWLVTIYLRKQGRLYWISLIPAVFMTAVCATYVGYDSLFLGQPIGVAKVLGVGVAVVAGFWFALTGKKPAHKGPDNAQKANRPDFI